MFDQGEQGPFTGVQRHEVDEVEQARLGQVTQLGVDETTPERDDHVRVLRLHRLRDAQRRVHRTGKRHRQQQQPGAVPIDGCKRQPRQALVHEVGCGGQRRGQGVETGLAGRQLLGVPHELEAAVDGVSKHVGQVVEVQGGEVARAVLQPQRAESPGQRVTAGIVDEHVERTEPSALGEPAPAHDAVRERRVTSLQEAQGGADRRAVALELGEKVRHLGRSFRLGQRRGTRAHQLEALRRKQVEHEGECQVLLHRRDAARAQEAREVGGRGVGRVELGHRRDDSQHPEVVDGHRLS